MTYDEALDYLRGREKFGIKAGLENIDRLAAELGRPERSYPSILIAGTNGKGSTAAMLASILGISGLRTGRYTSPHIRRIEERIQVGGNNLAPEELSRCVGRVAEAGARVGEPTFFEAMTACAFLAFRDREVDVAVLEVGMGGRWDATNISPASISVIAPVGFDHEYFLGDTLAAIAAEKAAIIKQGKPVVVGRQEPDALAVIEDVARRRSAELVHALEGVTAEVVGGTPSGERPAQHVRLETPEQSYGVVTLPLLGTHQVDNLVLAVRAAEAASIAGFLRSPVDPEHVRRGVSGTVWPGRLQVIPGSPTFLLDAAHNVMAATELARFLRARPRSPRVLVFGVMKDKRVHEMLELLLPHVTHFVATRPENSRARGPEPLAKWAAERGTLAEAAPSSARALRRARELAGPGGEIVVAGSIFLLGEVVAELERDLVPALPVHAPA